MKLEISHAKDRFSVLELGAGRDDFKTRYTCPNCSQITVLVEGDFNSSLFNDKSVLSPRVVSLLNNNRPLIRENWEEFYDFTCSGCNQSVRVIHSANEFRMACHNFVLITVIEIS